MSWSEFGKLYADNQEWKFKDEQERKKMKQSINIKTKPSSHEREIYMSQYVTLPRDQVRMMKTREVIAWGVALFMVIITFIR
jgi:hypothetical protein